MTVDAPAVPEISWTWKRFEDLSADDVYELLALRSEVFVVEQRCVFLDADGSDRPAWHLLGRTVAGAPRLAAYLRCIDPGVNYREPSIGRVVTAPAWRGVGLGRALMDVGLHRSHDAWPGADIVINAQLRLEPFYRSLGFRTEGEPYVEDDIEHVQMRLAREVISNNRRTT
ncbi:MAG: GNAT family N-acetyltransferase [Burkholderiaceae bacterium]